MLNFPMQARTLADDTWFPFTLADIPIRYDDDGHFALCNRVGTPLLSMSMIVRGDPETGLYEGNIVEYNDEKYVICYERGFYAINSNYISRNLYQIAGYKLAGDYWKDGFPIEIRLRMKQMFHYKKINFKLNDIVGHWGNSLLIRACQTPIDPNECQQECCFTYQDKKIFLGEEVNGHHVELAGGRICIHDEQGYLDLATGGYLNGYNSGSVR